jgi:hypothetical protein
MNESQGLLILDVLEVVGRRHTSLLSSRNRKDNVYCNDQVPACSKSSKKEDLKFILGCKLN